MASEDPNRSVEPGFFKCSSNPLPLEQLSSYVTLATIVNIVSNNPMYIYAYSSFSLHLSTIIWDNIMAVENIDKWPILLTCDFVLFICVV